MKNNSTPAWLEYLDTFQSPQDLVATKEEVIEFILTIENQADEINNLKEKVKEAFLEGVEWAK